MTLCFHLQLCSDVVSLKHLSAPETFRIHSTTSHSTSFKCEGWKGRINSNSKQFDIIFALWCAGNGKLWLLRLGSIICSIKNTNEDNKTHVSAAGWTVGTSQAGSEPVVSAEMETEPVSPLQPLSDRLHMIPHYYGLRHK